MEILGIGPLEFLLIIVIMLIVLGPKEMINTGQKAGRMIRKVINSPTWHSMMNASREIREMPTRLVRETGLEEDLKEIRRQTRASVETFNQPVTLPRIDPPTHQQTPVVEHQESTSATPDDDPSI